MTQKFQINFGESGFSNEGTAQTGTDILTLALIGIFILVLAFTLFKKSKVALTLILVAGIVVTGISIHPNVSEAKTFASITKNKGILTINVPVASGKSTTYTFKSKTTLNTINVAGFELSTKASLEKPIIGLDIKKDDNTLFSNEFVPVWEYKDLAYSKKHSTTYTLVIKNSLANQSFKGKFNYKIKDLPSKPEKSDIIIAELSKSIKPENDFWRYVNQSWFDANPLKPWEESNGIFADNEITTASILKTSIEQNLPAVGKTTSVYNAFLDSSKRETGLSGLESKLNEIQSATTTADVTKLIFNNMMKTKMGRATIGPFNFVIDNSGDNIVEPKIVYLIPATSYFYDNNKFLTDETAYKTYIKNVLIASGKYASGTVADNAADATWSMEWALLGSNNDWDNSKIKSTNTSRNIDDQDVLPSILQDINNHSLKNKKLNKTGLLGNPPQVIDFDVLDDKFGLDVSQTASPLIYPQKFAETINAQFDPSSNLDTIKAYFTFKLLDSYKAFLPTSIRGYSDTFYNSGAPADDNTLVMEVLNQFMPEQLSKYYLDTIFTPTVKQQGLKMISNILKAYKKSFQTRKWPSATTRSNAIKKLNKIKVKVGGKSEYANYDTVDTTGNLLNIIGSLNNYNIKEFGKKIGADITGNEWIMKPQDDNAYYSFADNSINIPASQFAPPLFNAERNSAENYAMLGASTIGHEIGHGFDAAGSKYDGDGVLNDWFANGDRAKYDALTSTLVNQFNKFIPKQLENTTRDHVDGALTIGENGADLAGLDIAYDAYVASLGGDINRANIINNLTGAERFFIAYATAWRVQTSNDYMKSVILRDVHSPAEFRVNGIVPNINGFYTAFNIKQGNMYLAPSKRLRIW
jgi:predicted metalloendopeptidase